MTVGALAIGILLFRHRLLESVQGGLGTWVFLGLVLGLGLPYLLLENLVTRVVASEAGLTSFNFLNRPTETVPYEAVTSYHRDDRGGWHLNAGGREIHLPSLDSADLHWIVAAHVPDAIAPKRHLVREAPAFERTHRYGLFDVREWMKELLGAALLCVPLGLLLRGVTLAWLATPLLSLLYPLKDLFGTLTYDSNEISARWPWRKRAMQWNEVVAVFCEQSFGCRHFVLTTLTESIVVPRAIAEDPILGSRLLSHLPTTAWYVNFDEPTQRVYGMRETHAQELGAVGRLS